MDKKNKLKGAFQMKKDSWLIVANTSVARIYKFVKGRPLKELQVFEHPESRLHNLDLVTDKPGRDFESIGGGTRRHALEQKVMPKKHEFAIFAKQLSDYLEGARVRGEFESIYIAASPTLLGLLRQSFHPNTAKLIKGELDKDMTQMNPTEIPNHLPFLF
jgi:protein required for attachment to host cells